MKRQIIFFFNDTATTEIYTLSLHDALPIWRDRDPCSSKFRRWSAAARTAMHAAWRAASISSARSEEHTSELQPRQYLVCRLLLEKKTPLRLVHSSVRGIRLYPGLAALPHPA